MSFELHPETPPGGTLLSERFKGRDLKPFYAQLQARGSQLGIVFNEQTILSNSRLALLASEYAREMGAYDAFHENMFRAYMTDAKDIGDLQVIASVAEESGLDGKVTLRAASDGRYVAKLEAAAREGRTIGLSGIPLCIINGQYKIVGAQPVGAFREFLDRLK